MTWLIAIGGAALGAGAGWLISKNISRFTGGVCPILCNPKVAIPYFAVMGLLIAVEYAP